jgi:hypothetical protein
MAKNQSVSPSDRDKLFVKDRDKARDAVAEKIARLRALREARDATDRATAAAQPVAAKKRATAKA